MNPALCSVCALLWWRSVVSCALFVAVALATLGSGSLVVPAAAFMLAAVFAGVAIGVSLVEDKFR